MIITTARLVLREYSWDDFAGLRAIHGDPEVQAMRGGKVLTEQETHDEIAYVIAAQAESPRIRYQFAVTFPARSVLIGYCRLTITNTTLKSAEIGYFFARPFWGQGYATEAATALLSLGFDDLGLHRIAGECIGSNIGSARVLEKIGMQLEARLHEHCRVHGVWDDTLIYAILDHEWRQRER